MNRESKSSADLIDHYAASATRADMSRWMNVGHSEEHARFLFAKSMLEVRAQYVKPRYVPFKRERRNRLPLESNDE